MANTKDATGGMGKLSRKTRARVDEELKEQELTVLMDTTVDLESLRPQISDVESFNKLIEAVQASTGKNESIAQLKDRIATLGKGVIEVAKEVAKLV
jgi:hypothetical protein